MPGHSRSKNGVAEPVIGPATSGRTRWLGYVPGIYVFNQANAKTWMAGTSPAMTAANAVRTFRTMARANGSAQPIPAEAIKRMPGFVSLKPILPAHSSGRQRGRFNILAHI